MGSRLLNTTTTGGGDAVARLSDDAFTVQATVTGTGAVSATVVVEASNDATNWLLLATITLSGTTSASDGAVFGAAWDMVRARCTAISGTGATVTAHLGGE